MLTETGKYFLTKQNVDLEDVESFNEGTQEVTFKNGIIRTCTLAYSRIMGYCVPIYHMANIGKRQEYRDRKTFKEQNNERIN